LTILLAATSVTPFTEKVGVPLLVALLGLVGIIATAVISSIGGRWAQAINRRRDGAHPLPIVDFRAWMILG
jgi:hypothetical protein